jgi:DNA replication and repair protein RecF
MSAPARTPPSRYLTRLRLTGFRNYTSAALDLDARHLVLVGHNGAGKTNLMEAISLLAPGRGLRRAAFEDLAQAGSDGGWAVAATLETPAGPVDLGTGQSPDGLGKPRRVRINGADARAVEALGEHIRVMWLTPAMDGLFTGPAGDRRRFLDRLVLTLIPGHTTSLNAYERAMRQRNRLLNENPDLAWLDAIETEMAAHATAVTFARADTLGHLAALLTAAEDAGPFPAATVDLSGLEPFETEATQSGALETGYIEAWRAARPIDRAAGRTTIGPHRADLEVGHMGKGVPARLCSTGEQKALLIGLVLAHAQLVADMSGLPPILLLDEIAAHLDENRRAALFDKLDELGVQCVMTGTDQMLFEALGDRALRVAVEDARLTPVP